MNISTTSRFIRLLSFIILAAVCIVPTAPAQSVPAVIFTDPPADAAHPAKMTVLHIPSHGLLINGIAYQPAGAGLHPTLVICHGFPETKRTSIWHRPSVAQDGMPSPSTTADPGVARAFTGSRRIWRTPTLSSLTCAIPRPPPAWG